MNVPATILVIEDDAGVSAMLDALLENEGWSVRVALDGLEGLLMLEQGVDLAILDVMMPDVDGIRVLRQQLDEGGGELPTPIVVITGSDEAAGVCRTLLDPFDVFTKPFDPDEVFARIRHHLGEDDAARDTENTEA